jgi:hypothetical protein
MWNILSRIGAYQRFQREDLIVDDESFSTIVGISTSA